MTTKLNKRVTILHYASTLVVIKKDGAVVNWAQDVWDAQGPMFRGAAMRAAAKIIKCGYEHRVDFTVQGKRYYAMAE